MNPVVIVDYGMGNLFSVASALETVGVPAVISGSPDDLLEASGIVLPGVGAFGDAMDHLVAARLVEPLREVCRSGRPVLAVCLGMQLLLGASNEFGRREGLGVVAGECVALRGPDLLRPKLPNMGWEAVRPPPGKSWRGTPLEPSEPGSYFYFVHSYHCVVEDADAVVATTDYHGTAVCAAFQVGALFACQFHPERSGPAGLSVYRTMFGAPHRLT